MQRKQQSKGSAHHKGWTREEDLRLIRQVQAFPQNMHKCFLVVAEELDRTESAVADRWYSKLSQDPRNLSSFVVPSQQKDGLWKKLLKFFRIKS